MPDDVAVDGELNTYEARHVGCSWSTADAQLADGFFMRPQA